MLALGGNNMKKFLLSALIISMICTLASCTKDNSNRNLSKSENYADSSQEKTVGLPVEKNRILIACFSRYGNTNYPDDVDASTSASVVIDKERYGTTEYMARMIQKTVGGELFPIRTVTPYTDDFDGLRDVNHNEMENNKLPELQKSNLDISNYDTIFIGYPVWASDVPQAVVSFLKQYDLSDKTVIPFCTHDGYGAGNSYNSIRVESSAKNMLEALAIEAKNIKDSSTVIENWLNSIGMLSKKTDEGETEIAIQIGNITLDGVLYNTALANEIKQYFPFTISMTKYAGREFYGGVDFYPESLEGGQKTFENGDITYCEDHHNMAIFYAQTDNPNLSVNVIPIGKVISDLSVFENLDNREEITFSLKHK